MEINCQSIWTQVNATDAHRKTNATLQGLTMDPHIQEQKQQYDHRNANANLQGLIIASSHTNKCIKQREDEWPMRWSYTHFHIIGTMANGWSYNCPQWANNKDMSQRQYLT